MDSFEDEFVASDWTILYENRDATEVFALLHDRSLFLYDKQFSLRKKNDK